MSKSLKESLRQKLDHKPSADFDAVFFEKLKQSPKHPNLFSNWVTWLVSGCATASVLFIAVNNYQISHHSFNHEEYVETVLEIQSTLTEEINFEDAGDLTSSASDEI